MANMKKTIKIRTLSSIHVGDGQTLTNNRDFITDNRDIYILSPNKIGEIIGTDNDLITKWLVAIDNNDLKSFLKLNGKGKNYQEFSTRAFNNFGGNIGCDMTLKTIIHDGRGYPYIPGSSIKGAIRSAIVGSILSKRINEKELNFTEAKAEPFMLFNNSTKVNNNPKRDPYTNPNFDIFRFITVGDATFSKGVEVGIKLILINERTSEDSLIDRKKAPQIVETIDKDCKAFFNMSINIDKYNYYQAKEKQKLVSFPNELITFKNLFECINGHTKQLVEDEINYYSNIGKTGAEYYIENLKEIKHEIDDCNPGKECILRLGQGIGWRFMTGAWAENLRNFYDDIVPGIRIRNEHYKDYDFPKSRRIDDESYLMGFVKLSYSE